MSPDPMIGPICLVGAQGVLGLKQLIGIVAAVGGATVWGALTWWLGAGAFVTTAGIVVIVIAALVWTKRKV